MIYIKTLTEFLLEDKIQEDKKTEHQRLATISDNKEYNNEIFDSSDKKDDPNYDIVIASEIPIGDKDPMKKFNKIVNNSKFWLRKKKRKK